MNTFLLIGFVTMLIYNVYFFYNVWFVVWRVGQLYFKLPFIDRVWVISSSSDYNNQMERMYDRGVVVGLEGQDDGLYTRISYLTDQLIAEGQIDVAGRIIDVINDREDEEDEY